MSVKDLKMRKNHKWNKDNVCVGCGIYREKETVKTLMAIHNGKDVNKYEVKYKYFDIDESKTFKRPLCHRTTYDD